MKLPLRWRSGSSRCGEQGFDVIDAGHLPSKQHDAKTRLTTPSTKESSTSKGSSSSYYLEEPSKPVDMDQFCEEDEDAALSKTSDAVVAIMATKECASTSHAERTSITPSVDEDRRMSALTKAMTIKQAILTKAIEGLFDDAFAVVLQKELSRELEELIITELKEKIALNLKKQGRVTKQFIDLIHRLEEEAMEKEAINRELRKRLKMANHLLEAEGVNAVESSIAAVSVQRRSFTSRKGSSPRTQPTNKQPRSPTDMFAITEIYCNHDVKEDYDEMSCLFDETAQNPKQPSKEQHSPLTEKTVTTVGSLAPILPSENELLEF